MRTKYKQLLFIITIFTMLFCLTRIKTSALETPDKTEITYCVSADEGRLLLNWNLKEVDGYELNLAQNEAFNKNPQILEYASDIRKASLVNLPTVTYYARIRCYNIVNNEKVYSDWSDVSTVDIHKHYYTRTISKRPTCTENGTYSYKCDCGRYYKMPINKFGHNYELVSEGTADKCSELKCTRCGDIQETKEHDFEVTKTVEATCQHAGSKEYTCKNCGYVKTEKTSDKVNHKYEVVKTENGKTISECIYCHSQIVLASSSQGTNNTSTKDDNKTVDKTYTIDLGNGQTTTVVGHYETSMADEIFNELNEYRASKGLKKLAKASDALQNAANIRGYEIVYTFDHYRPNGDRALISFRDSTRCCAENIAKYQKSATEVMTDWKNSSSHNSNMISKYPKSVAISVFAEKYLNRSGKVKYRYHFVQFFGW